MSLDHKSVVRMQDEYLCTYCGKSWDINDAEPPACLADNEVKGTGVPAYDPPRLESPTGRVMSPNAQRFPGNLQNIPRRTADSVRTMEAIRATLTYPYPYPYPYPVPPRAEAFALYFEQHATIIYADSMSMALGFFGRTMGHTLTPWQLNRIGIDRFTSMDEYCTGRVPRVEMNPAVMDTATSRVTNCNMRFRFVNITTFTNYLKASK